MLLPVVRSFFRPWLLPDARIWMLAVVLAGMLASSLGLLNSHGLAALASAQHGDLSVAGHGDSHHEEDHGAATESTLSHAHHSADHSHDNAPMPSFGPGSLIPSPPDWRRFSPARMKGLVAYRLERPPMA
jgi:hypothetical protein